MSSHTIVCPYNEDLFHKLHGKKLIIRLNNLEDSSKAIRKAGDEQIKIQCVSIHPDLTLAEIPVDGNWGGTPIALHVTGPGKIRDIFKKIRLLKRFNVRVYIPAISSENLSAIRFLSSLGISTSVVFQKDHMDWEELIDLMTYSLLGLVNHGTIEPFSYIASHYENCKYTDFSAVYFDDPTMYIHINNEGRLALTDEDLRCRHFISQSVDNLDDLDQNTEYIDRLQSWRNFFLEADGCAYCPGWRVCLGKFSNGAGKNEECKEFFTELMDVVERYKELKSKNLTVWQP